MANRVIANPQISIYDQCETKIKHATFLYLLDTYARYKEMVGDTVVFPSRSYNVFGKKANAWTSRSDFEGIRGDLSQKAYEVLEIDRSIRERMNLRSMETLLDTDEESCQSAYNDVDKLVRIKYIQVRSGQLYLDCPRIKRDFDLKMELENVNIFPIKARSEMLKMIENNMNTPLNISSNSAYTQPSGFGPNLNPLFSLSRIWSNRYNGMNVSMTASHNVLLKYVFLRAITNIPLEGNMGFDELLIWPKVYFEEGKDNWPISEYIDDIYKTDMLRVMFMKKYPSSDTEVMVSKADFKGARNFVYLVANLRRPLPVSEMGELEESYTNDMINFKYPKVLQGLYEEAKDISHMVNNSRDSGRLDENKTKLSKRYSNLLIKLNPFMPATVDLCLK